MSENKKKCVLCGHALKTEKPKVKEKRNQDINYQNCSSCGLYGFFKNDKPKVDSLNADARNNFAKKIREINQQKPGGNPPIIFYDTI